VQTWLLVLSLGSLVVGPVLLTLRAKGETAHGFIDALDGFALVATGGLALLHLLPEAMHHGGIWAGVWAAVGAALPYLVDKFNSKVSSTGMAQRLTSVALVVGLIPHVALESAALGAQVMGDGHSHGMGIAVAAHRLPVALLLFSMLCKRHSRRWAWLGILALLSATVWGSMMGDTLDAHLTEEKLFWLQALVAGALLHVIAAHRVQGEDEAAEPAKHDDCCSHVHHHHGAHDDHHQHDDDHHQHDHHHDPDHHHDHDHDEHHHLEDHAADQLHLDTASCSTICGDGCGHDHGHDAHGHHHSFDKSNLWPTAGALLGGVVLWVSLSSSGGHGHEADSHSLMETFFHLALETAPALLLAYVLAGVMGAGMSSSHTRWLKARTSTSQALRGVAFGLPLPICSCGVLPLYEALIRRGVPAAAALGFLVATPELSIDALLISVPLLGMELSLARLAAAFVVAVGVASVVGRFVAPLDVDDVDDGAQRQLTWSQRLKEGARFGLVELYDHTMPWVLAGLLLATLCEPLLENAVLQQLPTMAQVPLLALVGIPMYVCASGATPIAAVAIAQGVSPGAALAFLLAGPATNITTFGVLSKLHGRGVAIAFGALVTSTAVALGWAVDAFDVGAKLVEHSHAHADGSVLQVASLVALGALGVASLLRQGPRGALEQVVRPL